MGDLLSRFKPIQDDTGVSVAEIASHQVLGLNTTYLSSIDRDGNVVGYTNTFEST